MTQTLEEMFSTKISQGPQGQLLRGPINTHLCLLCKHPGGTVTPRILGSIPGWESGARAPHLEEKALRHWLVLSG